MRKTNPNTFSTKIEFPSMIGDVANPPAMGIPGLVVVCHNVDSRETLEALIDDSVAKREFDRS
jgi:hypothetical protein